MTTFGFIEFALLFVNLVLPSFRKDLSGSQVAEKLDQLDAATVTRWLSEHPSGIASILDFNPEDATNIALVERLSQGGIRFTRENIVRIAEAPPEGILALSRTTGEVVAVESPIFLEIGTNIQRTGQSDAGAGLVHILARHESNFVDRGVPKEEIVDLIMKALTQGRNIGSDSADGSRYVYEVIDSLGRTQYLSIVVGDNGYVVTAFPTDRQVYTDLLERLN
ncbi:hypothetical protein HJG54_17855 [Leptolyngbya sp. NK1-12]|uniref:Uncharacterized protein n=1 Tax=Leptolyngbya sp. NK1-12 TaxID=2547451 RepID=A0AA96WE39_9CYAN|nr:hypothetical protein [Leptolyngbya sp. NK1-12]WNZ24532.1 hypothetical protein HJG54_17855 [Leptolyngbya sp. NK1-12]